MDIMLTYYRTLRKTCTRVGYVMRRQTDLSDNSLLPNQIGSERSGLLSDKCINLNTSLLIICFLYPEEPQKPCATPLEIKPDSYFFMKYLFLKGAVPSGRFFYLLKFVISKENNRYYVKEKPFRLFRRKGHCFFE